MTDTENSLIEKMQKVGTWKDEYSDTVRICAQMMDDYENNLSLYSASIRSLVDYKQKPPIMTAMESLRRDILAYLRELGLTPAALRKMDKLTGKQKDGSLLEDVLFNFENGIV